MRKRLLKIKWENVLLTLFIPLAIIQFLKASIDFKLVSIVMSLTLYGGFYTVVQMTRQEALLSVKDEIEQPIISTLLNPIMIYIKTQKKRLSKQAIYKRPSLYNKSVF